MPAQVSDHRFLQNVLGVAHVTQIGIGEPENAVAVGVQRGGGLYVFRALRGRMREKLLNPRGKQRKKLPKALPGAGEYTFHRETSGALRGKPGAQRASFFI